jgi:hypothetical protein
VARSILSPAGLYLAEQLVIWAWRKRLEGEARVAAVQRGFALAGSGPRRHDAHAAFEALFGVLFEHCRRDLWFHRCGCCCVSVDEMEILGLIAAEQADDMASALTFCRSLVAALGVGDTLREAERLGRALAERGLVLPLRCRLAPKWTDPGAERCH